MTKHNKIMIILAILALLIIAILVRQPSSVSATTAGYSYYFGGLHGTGPNFTYAETYVGLFIDFSSSDSTPTEVKWQDPQGHVEDCVQTIGGWVGCSYMQPVSRSNHIEFYYSIGCGRPSGSYTASVYHGSLLFSANFTISGNCGTTTPITPTPTYTATPTLISNGLNLDPTFGIGGKVKTLFDHLSWVQAVAVQTDGKIVVVGAGYENYDYCDTGGCLALARYNPDGSVDTGFGQGGTVITDIGFEDNSKGNAVVLQSDGKIVVAGSTIWSGFVLARYNSDGSLDNGFGNGGYVTTSFSWLVGYPSGDYRGDGRAVALQADGKIVVAGLTNGDEYVALARYNNNGSLDTGFGNGGRVMSNFGYSGLGGYAIKLQSDGKIIVAGACIPNNFNYDIFFLGRFNPDGSVDTSFGSGGTVATDFSGNWDIEGRAVVLQADGKIVVAGFYYPDTSIFNFALARYNSDGSLDTGFGSGGRVTTDFFGGDAKGSAAALLADGKIVVAGSSNGDFALALYNSNGSLDNGFGNGGKVTTDFGGDDEGYAVALQTDGKILVAGSSYQNYIFVALARYVESEPTPTPTPTLTVTPTSTPTPSATSTPEKNFIHLYLPVIVR